MTDATPAEPAADPPPVTLAEYVQAVSDVDKRLAADSAEEAEALVDQRIGKTATERKTVPAAVRRRAILEVGSDLYYRKSSRSGVAGFESADVQPIRLARDPMLTAAAILRPYLRGLA